MRQMGIQEYTKITEREEQPPAATAQRIEMIHLARPPAQPGPTAATLASSRPAPTPPSASAIQLAQQQPVQCITTGAGKTWREARVSAQARCRCSQSGQRCGPRSPPPPGWGPAPPAGHRSSSRGDGRRYTTCASWPRRCRPGGGCSRSTERSWTGRRRSECLPSITRHVPISLFYSIRQPLSPSLSSSLPHLNRIRPFPGGRTDYSAHHTPPRTIKCGISPHAARSELEPLATREARLHRSKALPSRTHNRYGPNPNANANSTISH